MARSFLVLVTILAASISAPGVAAAQSEPQSQLTLERIFKDRDFSVRRFGPARWLEDGSGYTTLERSSEHEGARDIIRYDPATGDRTVFVAATNLKPEDREEPLAVDDYHWSEDGRLLLVYTNSQRVWRRNTRGDYWLLDLEDGSLRQLGGDAEPASMMFAKLSPSADRVAWVDFNQKDLFVQDLKTMAVTRLTTAHSDSIINGTSDWVYEEEFSLRDGFRWSPDGRRIAYWQFDTSGVPVFTIINNTDELYPQLTPFQYPKVGQTNSACRVGVIDAGGGATTWFEPPGDSRQHYIPRMGWAGSSDRVFLVRLNRLQNTAKVMIGDARTGEINTIFTDTDEAWIDLRYDPVWIDDLDGFAWLSDRDGWRHLYLVSRSDGEVRLLTPGDYDVIAVEQVDAKNGWAYIAASRDDAISRILYRVPIDGSGKLERVTPASSSGTHRYQISHDGKWAIHTASSFETVPRTDLVTIPDHQPIRTLQDNGTTQEAVDAVAKQPVEFYRVEIEEGVELDGWMIKPPDFDPAKKYPLLMFVYGEPAGQTVRDDWGRGGPMWHLLLAQKGFVVASLDNRGTPGPRGRDWRKSVYRQIGILASADQAAGLEALLASRPYLDPARVGIWGWSGGGSMTLNAMFRYPELYSAGIAIAFISDQKLYDTIYQERYMGLPDDNAEGYEKGSPITYAHQLEGDLLIIHGTGDDNCHYQNFELLVNELIRHNKDFSMMSYPNRTHGIYEGENTTLHLYGLMTRYLIDHLQPEEPSTEESLIQSES
jgi:dipeptidyl-peptidase-4